MAAYCGVPCHSQTHSSCCDVHMNNGRLRVKGKLRMVRSGAGVCVACTHRVNNVDYQYVREVEESLSYNSQHASALSFAH